ncbi:MAG: phage tail sheath family protein [Candidatus Promineifilaceae bacterium]
MPVFPTYPGVYVEELPSGVRTIIGVATSITALVGKARRGPTDRPVRIQSFADYSRTFGGLWAESTMSYAVRHFFQNGGTDALIVRLVEGTAAAATVSIPRVGGGTVDLAAANEGEWGERLRAVVDYQTADPTDNTLFNLTIEELDAANQVVAREVHRNLRIDPAGARFLTAVLAGESSLARVAGPLSTTFTEIPTQSSTMFNSDGDDGADLGDGEYQGDPNLKTGIFRLEDADLFNLLCLPPPTFDDGDDISNAVWTDALDYCQDRRAILIVDPPASWDDTADAEGTGGVDGVGELRADIGGTAAAINAAVYFPRLLMPDPLQENRPREFAPCGAVAGLIARTDAQRGVWKAPAGIEASLSGVDELSYRLTDGENGRLNPLGLNCLRTFPVYGHVVWGARSLAGDDRLANQWKYLPVRRTALFIEETLYRGLQWVVFEPNDESLWAQIRLNVGAFMQDLFRKGAFQGSSPRQAYFVKCDSETTTQTDIDSGVVNILVGFAPLKPAEFVIIQIQQLAGQSQA